MREKPAFSLPGGAMLLLLLVAIAGTLFVLMSSAQMQVPAGVILAMLALGVEVICLRGLLIVNPNEGQVLQLFGTYVGTLRDQGLRWVNPFNSKRRISLRVRNFETSKLKVNDLEGNPIEIAAVVVWQVVDTAEAVFQVDSYENFVAVQSESALRTMATSYAYDSHVAGQMSLQPHRGNCCGTAERNPGPLGESRRASGGSAHQSPGLRCRNRRGDAAAPAGFGDHLRAADHRRRSGEHCANGARSAFRKKSCGAGSRASRCDGQQ